MFRMLYYLISKAEKVKHHRMKLKTGRYRDGGRGRSILRAPYYWFKVTVSLVSAFICNHRVILIRIDKINQAKCNYFTVVSWKNVRQTRYNNKIEKLY